MRPRVVFWSTSLLLAVFFISPLIASAAILPFFGPILPPNDNLAENVQRCAAAWGAVFIVVNNVIRVLLTIAIVFVAPLTIGYAGFLFVTSPASVSNVEKAKKILTNTVVGITIALASWLIVNAIMSVLYDKTARGLDGKDWWEIVSSGGADTCLDIAATQRPSDRTGESDTTYEYPAGTCTPPTVGVCSVTNLQSTCFGSNASAAGQICSKESGGNPGSLSRTDVTSDGHAYSGGLFQINITNSFNQQVNGKSCSAAFSEPCQGSAVVQSGPGIGRCRATVVDMSLYDACIAAVTNADTNITAACGLSNGGTTWGRWRHSADSCGLPR